MSKLFLGSALLLVMSFFMGSCSLVRSFSGHHHAHTEALSSSLPDTGRSSAPRSSLPDSGRSSRSSFVPLPPQDTSGAAATTASETPMLLDKVSPLFARHTDFTTFTCKAKVSFEGPDESKEFNAIIRVKKDSAIWVAISALGLQVARVFITPDSFFMVVPLQREGTKLSLAHVAKVLPTTVDFRSLQNLIIGDPLRGGKVTDVAELGASFLLMVADSSYLQRINYARSGDNDLLVDQVNTRDPQGPQAILYFKDYSLLDGGRKFSTSRHVTIQNGNDHYTLDLDIKDPDFNHPIEMPFAIPRSYKIKGE